MRTTFALYFANRGFFPGELIASSRQEMIKAVTDAGFDYICMDENLTRFGAVETIEEGKAYAEFLKKHEGEYQGIILCLPNFGDENGASVAGSLLTVEGLLVDDIDEIIKMNQLMRQPQM